MRMCVCVRLLFTLRKEILLCFISLFKSLYSSFSFSYVFVSLLSKRYSETFIYLNVWTYSRIHSQKTIQANFLFFLFSSTLFLSPSFFFFSVLCKNISNKAFIHMLKPKTLLCTQSFIYICIDLHKIQATWLHMRTVSDGLLRIRRMYNPRSLHAQVHMPTLPSCSNVIKKHKKDKNEVIGKCNSSQVYFSRKAAKEKKKKWK